MGEKRKLRITHKGVNTLISVSALVVAIAAGLPAWIELAARKPSAGWGLYCGPGDSICLIYVGITNQDFNPLESVEVKLVSSCGVSLPSGADEIDIGPPVRAEVEAAAQMVHVRTQAVLGRGDRMDIWFPVSRSEVVLNGIADQKEFAKCFRVYVFSNAGLGKSTIVHVETPFVHMYYPIIVRPVTPTPMGILPNLPLP